MAGSQPNGRHYLKKASASPAPAPAAVALLPLPSLEANDSRRTQIQNLDEVIGAPFRMMSNPRESLSDCYSLIQVLDQELDGCARLYHDAFQIIISHGDQARASVFAERAYKARVVCEGEDSPETVKVMSLALRPAIHISFEAYSRKLKRTRNSVTKGLDTIMSYKTCYWKWQACDEA
ncbi:hypothetical protein GLAREA_06278 [Glarea lozoyensis ATCC 20868]|uniref:Uncharacterized protein n=1 Tax=Glarea lozoyensis (strain ATCC 20868 / MF5171) TaxID=1116229 RepID=S3DMF9_GLAL2|nr:uncharacterized protein GLAREA_06278 [Glarea lozoyensis ATCC 20868]EPE33266.1 hypothetical protein GLAREA_06278 [Glarea lozoyensis ATCC 20868]